MPVTSPDPVPIVATVVVPLAHVPPGEVSASVVVRPAHTVAVPVITAGSALTKNGYVMVHPVGNV